MTTFLMSVSHVTRLLCSCDQLTGSHLALLVLQHHHQGEAEEHLPGPGRNLEQDQERGS